MGDVMKKKLWFFVLIGICAVSVSVHSYMIIQASTLKQDLSSSASVVNCSGCDLRGVVGLAGVDAHGIQLALANFQPCVPSDANKNNGNMICIKDQVSNLAGINLANAFLYSVCFDHANLEKATLSGADATFASFQYADLNEAKVDSMITEGAVFCNATMPDGRVCSQQLDTWTGQGVTIKCNCQNSSGPSSSK